MTLHRSHSLFIAAAAFAALACSSPDKCIPLPVEAPIAYQPPLIVGVVDSVTGKPIADSATGTMQSSSASDSLRHGYVGPVDSILVGTLGPGWYTVKVQHPLYLPWVRTGVIITPNSCGAANTTHLTARLQRGP